MSFERDRQSLWTVFGLSAGVATGVAAGVWFWRRRSEAPAGPVTTPAWVAATGSAQDVAASLRADGKLSRRRIEVDTIAEGVIELSGTVRDRSEADRAVGLAQRTTGVYTVVNRLRIEEEESHRESTRRRWSDGAPDLRERHHYGMGVGMGQSRHSPATDPDRPSDKHRILNRELDVANVVDEAEGGPNPVSGAGSVDDPYMKPGDEMAIREAGLDPSPRPMSTPQESVDEGPSGSEQDGSEPDGEDRS
jgi:hypothetical protein